MIDDVDNSVRNLLQGEARSGSELAAANISFTVPDSSYRGSGTGLKLNAYLFHIAENRELRSNERRISVLNGLVTLDEFPTRIDCTYALSAWNRAQPAGVEPELQEHRLLAQVLVVLMRNPLLPRQYLAGSLAANQEIDLPVVTARPDAAAPPPDFWTNLGTYVRPTVVCRITFSLELGRAWSAPPMTTATVTANGDSVFVVGGTVYDRSATPLRPVPAAWIRVDQTGETAIADGQGHFFLRRIGPGTYTFTVRAAGYLEGGATHAVPSPSAVYDVLLTPA